MTENDKAGLNERQIKALPFFAACTTYEEACRRAEISRNTFYEWLKDPSFKSELNRLRDSIIEESVAILKTSATEAMVKLVQLMRGSSSDNVQRMAAKDLLDYLISYREHYELAEDIRELKKIAYGIKTRS